jgi:signal transduction histidine kinase
MPEGGTLHFRAEAWGGLPPEVINALSDHDAHRHFVAIAILDNSAGMNEEVKKRVFELFFTTKDAGIPPRVAAESRMHLGQQTEYASSISRLL